MRTNYSAGHEAEEHAAKYLKKQGFLIRELNWKTRFCEIDIVARNGSTIYFIEVKYRKSAQQGSGLDYVTPKKLQQMKFAAEMWVTQDQWTGDYRLGAVEVSGEDFRVTNFVSDWM